MKNEALNQLMKHLDALNDMPIYPIGTKIYRVMESGSIYMDKVESYEITVDTDGKVRLTHKSGNGYGSNMMLPEDHSGYGGYGRGSKIVSFHFDRKSANKAAAPLLKAEKLKEIERNKDRIAELQGANMKLEAETR